MNHTKMMIGDNDISLSEPSYFYRLKFTNDKLSSHKNNQRVYERKQFYDEH